jgi:hypothetical protein
MAKRVLRRGHDTWKVSRDLHRIFPEGTCVSPIPRVIRQEIQGGVSSSQAGKLNRRGKTGLKRTFQDPHPTNG